MRKSIHSINKIYNNKPRKCIQKLREYYKASFRKYRKQVRQQKACLDMTMEVLEPP